MKTFWYRLWGPFEMRGVIPGLSPQKLISFGPFVNYFMAILVNFLDFAAFFLSFPLFSDWFFRGDGATAYRTDHGFIFF